MSDYGFKQITAIDDLLVYKKLELKLQINDDGLISWNLISPFYPMKWRSGTGSKSIISKIPTIKLRISKDAWEFSVIKEGYHAYLDMSKIEAIPKIKDLVKEIAYELFEFGFSSSILYCRMKIPEGAKFIPDYTTKDIVATKMEFYNLIFTAQHHFQWFNVNIEQFMEQVEYEYNKFKEN